jgi:hypothetical protein
MSINFIAKFKIFKLLVKRNLYYPQKKPTTLHVHRESNSYRQKQIKKLGAGTSFP